MGWLDSALDYGISEETFWDSTIAELIRMIESKKRIQRMECQQKASFDYALADLIGRSVSRLMHSSNTMPDIEVVYPALFDSQQMAEAKAERQAELSAARFRQFADSFNQKFKKKGVSAE